MFRPFHPTHQSISSSRLRALVRDVCGCLQQQMFLWGCDARRRDGNLLVRFGMTRIARGARGSEGSSRYRISWRDGKVELHSFCAGWYPQSGEGVLFIRNRDRLYACSGDEALAPGGYESERHAAATPDAMLLTCRPLVEWIVDYESWVRANTAPDYRHRCWMRHLSRMGARPWLPPEQAHEWRKRFLTDPRSVPRAKELLANGRMGAPRATTEPTKSSKYF